MPRRMDAEPYPAPVRPLAAFSVPNYRRFVVAFKLGKTAHIEVQNAAVMEMSNDVSLVGFMRKFRSQS